MILEMQPVRPVWKEAAKDGAWPLGLSVGLLGLVGLTWGGEAMVGDILWPTVAGGLWGVALLVATLTGGLRRFRERALRRPWPWIPPLVLFAAAAAGWASYGAGTLWLAAMLVVLGARRPRIALLALATLAVLVVVPLEAFLLWARSSPAAARHPLLSNLSRDMYLRLCQMPQLSRECSAFDSELLYRLRPGSCRFGNEEYSTTISVNSLGVRGTEADLTAPEIIVLGDSYSMGWGVEDDETYAAELERRTGRRTLNLAIASYGTARQLEMLARADRSRVDAIILQYCSNDLAENRAYVERGFAFPPHTATEHREWLDAYERRRSYYPGKLTVYGLWSLWEDVKHQFRPPRGEPRGPHEDSRLLGRLLERHAELLEGARLLIFWMSDPGRELSGFREDLQQMAEAIEAPLEIEILDVEADLGPQDFFDLDPHLTPGGHQAVADRLEPWLESERRVSER